MTKRQKRKKWRKYAVLFRCSDMALIKGLATEHEKETDTRDKHLTRRRDTLTKRQKFNTTQTSMESDMKKDIITTAWIIGYGVSVFASAKLEEQSPLFVAAIISIMVCGCVATLRATSR